MVRKSKKKKPADTKAPKPTYHKSKNGRYYKKSTLANGKSQTRFCSKAEAEGGLVGSGAKRKRPNPRAKPKGIKEEKVAE